MNSGGIRVNQRTRETIRLAAVLAPLVLSIYGIVSGIEPASGMPDYLSSVIMAPWLLLGLLIYFLPANSGRGMWLRAAVYHLFAGAYVTLISGPTAPYIALCWTLLLLTTYLYLSVKGIILSLGTFLGATAILAMLQGGDMELIASGLMTALAIGGVGAIMIVLMRIQRTDSEELLRSKAQESLQNNRINTLINNLADAVININNEGRVEVYNAASLGLLNTNISLNQRPIDDVITLHDQSGAPVKLFDVARKTRGVSIRDDLLLTVEDEPIRLEVTISPIRSSYSRTRGESSADGYVLILRDVTKAKSLEEERDEFISVVSHELRTPITIAEGTLSNVQLMLSKGSVPPGTLERGLESAHEQILYLSRMVNDLSTLSRAERGIADAPEEIDVKKLVDSLYNEYMPQAEKKQLHFNIDATGKLGTVTASHLYLRELLQNLITNAIKYTKEGSVTLKVSRHGEHIAFGITDTGIGISKNDQAKIFKKFYRSEDYRTRETGGTGLGLYVAAKLSKKLGTTIEVKSRLDHGSTFSFSLPVSDDRQSQE